MLKSLLLFIITAFDVFGTGLIVLLISIFSKNRKNLIYDWTEGWGRRALQRYNIKVKIIGEENWKNAKRALMLANHQSMIEAFILSKYLRYDLVFVGKKTLKWIPIFGPLYILSKQILLDRFHHKRALKGLEKARQKIEEGYSLYLAPEGTRSKDGKLSEIKKGFFHLALQTKAPILPLTYVNAYRIQPKHSIFIRSGEVILVFDKLIETKDWKPEEIDLRREQIRKIYQKNLNQYGDPCQYVPID